MECEDCNIDYVCETCLDIIRLRGTGSPAVDFYDKPLTKEIINLIRTMRKPE